MTRMLLRSRRLLAVSTLLLLAGLVLLSAATRQPCLRVNSASWHVFKSGYMDKSEGPATCKLRVSVEAHAPRALPEDSPAPAPWIHCFPSESVPPANTVVVRLRHFRSPPARA